MTRTSPTLSVSIPDSVVLPALPPGRIARPAVVLVVGPGPVAEIYSDLPIRLHIAERLAVDPDAERLADEYMNSTLPGWARDVYMPGKLRARVPIQPRTVDQEGARLRGLDVLHALQELGLSIHERQGTVTAKIIPRGPHA